MSRPPKRSSRRDLRRQKSAISLRRSPFSPAALIDQVFLIFAGLASFWLAWLVWREAWHSGGWWLVGLFFVVWSIVAYLALPRIHRILSSIYVPNYFIGRTRTSDGLLGDPVNLALRGSEAQLHHAMTAAGWTLADEITPRSTWRIIIATLMRKSYASAPVSSLYLFGRRQDFTYQQEIDGSPGKRHHVRFWRCPKGWLLPGGHKADWLAAGSYDRGIGLSFFTLQFTHRIDENIDIERDYIVDSVTKSSPEVSVTSLKDFSTGYHSRNGGGDSIQTDGDLLVLELGEVEMEAGDEKQVSLILDATNYGKVPKGHDTVLWQLWERRPPQVSLALVLMILAICVAASSMVYDLVNTTAVDQEISQAFSGEGLSEDEIRLVADFLIISSIIISVVWIIITGIFMTKVYRGKDLSRLILMTLASLSVIAASSSLTIGKITWTAAGQLFFIGLNICVVLLLSSDSARRFTQAHSRRQKAN